MVNRYFILLCACLMTATVISGQCITSDSLWKRLVFLKNQGYAVSVPDQLSELQRYEATMLKCGHNADSIGAFLLFRIGAMHYKLGDYLKAIAYTEKSIAIVASAKQSAAVNISHLISTYYYLSVFYGAINKVSAKMRALDSCVAVSMRAQAVDLFCLNALYQRTEYFFDIGDFQRCYSYAEQCEKLAGEHGKKGAREYSEGTNYISDCFAWKVNVLLKLENFDSAEALLLAKAEEYRKLSVEHFLGSLYEQLANVQINKRNYDRALQYYYKAIYYHKKYGFFLATKITLCNIGYTVYYKYYHDWDKALSVYRSAINCVNKDIAQIKLDSMESLNILDNIANVFAQKKMYDSAHLYYQLAFNQMRPGANEATILNSPFDDILKKKINYLTGLVIDKADTYAKQYIETGKPAFANEAIRIYKVADQLLDKVKAEQTDMQSKLIWRMDSRRLYENAIRVCCQNKNAGAAFYFFEKSKAVMLLDKLNESRWIDEKDIVKQIQLRKNIYQREQEIKTLDVLSPVYNKIKNELFSQNQELDRLIGNIRNTNPLYYQAYLDTGRVKLEDVHSEILKDHDVFIELFAGDSSVFCMVIAKKGTDLYEIDKLKFDSLVEKYTTLISDPIRLNKQTESFFATSDLLYKLLFQNKPVPAGRVIISPDGKYFPFEALVTKLSPVKYFLDDHAVSYAYSARYLMNDFQSDKENKAGTDFLGIAPVHFATSLNLAALPGSDQSLYQLDAYFAKAENLTGADATKSNFLQKYSGYGVIQLYTHAADSSENGEPVIYFRDSLLYLSELATEMKPLTRLIVLSACETGTGKLFKGEGVFSFSRGFAAMGIPAAVTNLWSIDDVSTYKINELFYKYLSQGEPTDIALQKAKLTFIKYSSKEGRLPFYWAAPVLAGKTSSIAVNKPVSWYWFIALVLLLSTVVALWLWKLKSKTFYPDKK